MDPTFKGITTSIITIHYKLLFNEEMDPTFKGITTVHLVVLC